MISILDKYRKTWDDEALAVDCQYAVHLKNPALLGCMRRKQRRNDQPVLPQSGARSVWRYGDMESLEFSYS